MTSYIINGSTAGTIPPHCLTPETNPNNTWHLSCNEDYHNTKDFVYLGLVLLAASILLFLSKRQNAMRWGCCNGQPGWIIPLNMLDGYENRLAYAGAFGVMTFELTSILREPNGRNTSFSLGWYFKDDPIVSRYPIVKVLLSLLQVAICTGMFYPLFAALSTGYKFIGAVLGIILSLYKLASFIWLSSCVDLDFDNGIQGGFTVGKYLLILLIWPNIIMFFVLISQYVLIIVHCCKGCTYLLYPDSKDIALPHHNIRVSLLLGKQPLPWIEQSLHHVSIFNKQKFMQNFAFRHIPGFKFPTRIIATFVVTVISLYQIGLQVAFQVFRGLKVFRRYIRCRAYLLPSFIVDWLNATYSDFMNKLEGYANLAAYLWIIVMLINILLAIGYIYHSCLCYRKHTMRMYRGDHSIFPRNWIRESKANILASASRHAGFQIAYTIWGFVIIQMFTFIIVCFVVFIIIIPVSDFANTDILNLILQVILGPLALSMLMFYGQVIASRFLFLQPKTNRKDDAPPLAMDNKRAWNNQAFFFFFWNLFLGVISALLRIIKGLVLGVFFIPRIDRPVLMRGFETKDNGFYAYLALLSTINAHDHPVVKVFVDVLTKSVQEKERQLEYLNTTENSSNHTLKKRENTYRGTKRARWYHCYLENDRRYYWNLAYTLIHNPDLIVYRKVECEDGVGGEYGAIKKHKVVLAIHRKKQGQNTAAMYNINGSSNFNQLDHVSDGFSEI